VSHYLRGNETDTPDICVTIFFVEAQAFREMCPHDVAVKESHLTPMFQ
jgi:hypothetical protein